MSHVRHVGRLHTRETSYSTDGPASGQHTHRRDRQFFQADSPFPTPPQDRGPDITQQMPPDTPYGLFRTSLLACGAAELGLDGVDR